MFDPVFSGACITYCNIHRNRKNPPDFTAGNPRIPNRAEDRDFLKSRDLPLQAIYDPIVKCGNPIRRTGSLGRRAGGCMFFFFVAAWTNGDNESTLSVNMKNL